MSPLPSSSRRRSIGSERAGWDAPSVPAAPRATAAGAVPDGFAGAVAASDVAPRRRRGSIEPMPTARRLGIITAGGESPGLNAAIRGFGKAAISQGLEVVGFRDGFRGLAEDRRVRLDTRALAGILTVGGTILGTSRDKPHRMP